MPQNIQLTDTLIEYLEAIHAELANMTGTRHGIFPPAGPLTVPFASSKATRTLARKQGITVMGKTILFVINSEPDLGRVFAEVRSIAGELNSIGKKLTTALVDALGAWGSTIEAATPATAQADQLGPEIPICAAGGDCGNGNVFGRHIALTPSLLEGLRLLNTALSKWSPAKFGIFPPAGPLTVVIQGSDVLRILARKLGLSTTSRGVVLFITSETTASEALGSVQQLSAEIATVVEAIPPSLKKQGSKTAGGNNGTIKQDR